MAITIDIVHFSIGVVLLSLSWNDMFFLRLASVGFLFAYGVELLISNRNKSDADYTDQDCEGDEDE